MDPLPQTYKNEDQEGTGLRESLKGLDFSDLMKEISPSNNHQKEEDYGSVNNSFSLRSLYGLNGL